jgi:hypothetical protein
MPAPSFGTVSTLERQQQSRRTLATVVPLGSRNISASIRINATAGISASKSISARTGLSSRANAGCLLIKYRGRTF